MNSGGLAAPAPYRGTGAALDVALVFSSGNIPSRTAGRRTATPNACQPVKAQATGPHLTSPSAIFGRCDVSYT
jgi:hypothetical protein